MALTKPQVRALQRDMNQFQKKYLRDMAPLRVDGDLGPATKARVKTLKYYLGRDRRTRQPGKQFRRAIQHPRTIRYSTAGQLAKGPVRRQKQRRQARQARAAASRTTGASSWRGGKVVANWLHPYLDYAKDHGWPGWVVSGYRDPAYSESLCLRMCGRPSCPGRCAGRSSNHAGSVKPQGAIDVTHYQEFGRHMKSCPLQPKIWCGLSPADPVHFSASGR
jgi:hypothetical protein